MGGEQGREYPILLREVRKALQKRRSLRGIWKLLWIVPGSEGVRGNPKRRELGRCLWENKGVLGVHYRPGICRS